VNLRTVGLRVSSGIFGLISLGHIARLWGRVDILIGGHRFERGWSWITIIASGLLAIWLAKLAGPWSAENGRPSTQGF
jgi:hypothetical protein